jgi:heat shock protein HslJ
MTDEQMDARLRRAGEAWRTAATPVDEIAPTEPEELTTPSAARPRRHRTGLLASAAVVAAALVAGGSVLVANLNGGSDKRGADMEGVALQGTVWQFVGYGDHLNDRSSSTLYISADGRLVADDECELLSAQVDAASGSLDVTGLAERYKGCVDTYEPAFGRGIDLLNSNPPYSIDATGLTIGAGDDAMHFAASKLPAPVLDVPTFTETDWRLVSATDADGNASSVDGDLVFHVQGGRFKADEGCNKLSGELTDAGSQPDIKTVESTTLPCPSPQPFEQVMQAVFQPGPVDAAVRGAELTISRDGAGSLTYQWVPADADATNPNALVGHDWQLASVAGVPASGDVGLYAGPSELSVIYGCGAVGGHARIGHGTLHIDGMTEGAAPGCIGDIGDQSSTIDSFLASDPLWRIQDGKLVITDSGGAQAFALVFEPGKPQQKADVPLAGTNWTLAKALDADKHDVPVAGNAALLIDDSNRLTGSDGCNSFSGDVTVDKTTIGFGAGLAITELACTDDQVAATAARVDAVLHGEISWSISGDELALTKDGVGTLVYQEAQPTTKSTDPNDLIGATWKLTTIETGGPDGIAQTPDQPSRIVISASSLDFGCDRANVTLGNGTLAIGAFHMIDPQLRGCHVFDAQEIEAVLAGKVSWVIEGDQLTIAKDGVGGLVFTSQPTGTDQLALVGTPWQLSAIDIENENNGSGSGSSDSGIVLTVGTDGGYKLVTGCHNYAGTATVGGSTVTFAAQRDLGGDDCLNTLAKALVQFLDGPMTWSITGGELTLTQGASSATFTG